MNSIELNLQNDRKTIMSDFNQQAIDILNTLVHENKPHQILISSEKGMGKSYLIHSYLKLKEIVQPNINVSYQSAYKFFNDYISSLRNQSLDEFKQSFYAADIIVLEDIEFLKGKKRTQSELLQLVSEFIGRNKTLVFSVNTNNKKQGHVPKFIKKMTTNFSKIQLLLPSLVQRKHITTELLRGIYLKEPDSVIYYLAKYGGKTVGQIKSRIQAFELASSDKDIPLTIEWLNQHSNF